MYTTCLNDCGLFLIERYQLRAVDLEESSSRESRRIKRIGGDQQHLEELQLRPTSTSRRTQVAGRSLIAFPES
ncbi:MAG TPA: hypothetical protein VE083_05100 [Terriglobales bacterium]|nr:hypothetical protein [Terriglobales bacterium]